jgi:hypothetical protein
MNERAEVMSSSSNDPVLGGISDPLVGSGGKAARVRQVRQTP